MQYYCYFLSFFIACTVFYYNFCWSDYDVPTLEALLDAVKVIDNALSMGKVAVHCHAGLGRTGVLIACHLVYSLRYTGNKAIIEVRRKRLIVLHSPIHSHSTHIHTHTHTYRPGSIQTRSQIEIVQQFSLHLSTLWTFFPLLQIRNHKSTKVTNKEFHTTEVREEETLHLSPDVDSVGAATTSSTYTHGLKDGRTTVEKQLDYGCEPLGNNSNGSLHRSDDRGSVPSRPCSRIVRGGKSNLSFDDLLYNQSQVLHGEIQIDLKYIPKVSVWTHTHTLTENTHTHTYTHTQVIHDLCVRLTELSVDRSCDLPFDVILHHSTVNGGACEINSSSLDALCCHDYCIDDMYTSIQNIQVKIVSTELFDVVKYSFDVSFDLV